MSELKPCASGLDPINHQANWGVACLPIVRQHDWVKVRDVIRMIEDDGWKHIRTRGSHRQFKHGTKPGLVTVAGKPSDDLAPGTLASILKQAGLN